VTLNGCPEKQNKGRAKKIDPRVCKTSGVIRREIRASTLALRLKPMSAPAST
jgi:hypothetical protein